MNDTPADIKELQLKIWLSKSPMERLRQIMEDNASLAHFWQTAKKMNDKSLPQEIKISNNKSS